MRLAARAMAAAVLLALAPCAADAEEMPRALHALRLAPLAERIAKLHAQLGQGVLAERSRRLLAEAKRDFEASLGKAGPLAGTAEARDAFLLLAILWGEYRVWAEKPPTRDNARKLAERTDEVAWVAAKAARLSRESRAGSLADQAARACVLSQRVPRLYLMRRWEPRNEALAREAAAASRELGATLAALASGARDQPEAAADIQVAETQYGFMARAGREMERSGAGLMHAETLAKTGDHILETMLRVARRYEAAGL